MDAVAIVESGQDIKKNLLEGLQLLEGFGTLKPQVIIKPNICTISDGTGFSITDVNVVESVVELVLKENEALSIKIVESDSQSKFADDAFEKFGYKQLVEKHTNAGFDVSLVDLSRPPFAKLKVEDAHVNTLELASILFEPNYFISIAVAKTHENTFLTGVLKNQFGLLPKKEKGLYHPTIDDYIVDLNRFAKPDLCIIDARTGVEGWNGPKTREMGCFILGHKPVSVDATMARVMGFEPSKVSHIMKSSKYNLGSLNPQIRGLDIDSVRVKFKAPF
ncbi:MAG: DUF362 domain-containing protein [Candidatus Thorarchaeota archaeon]